MSSTNIKKLNLIDQAINQASKISIQINQMLENNTPTDQEEIKNIKSAILTLEKLIKIISDSVKLKSTITNSDQENRDEDFSVTRAQGLYVVRNYKDFVNSIVSEVEKSIPSTITNINFNKIKNDLICALDKNIDYLHQNKIEINKLKQQNVKYTVQDISTNTDETNTQNTNL
jgi:hypothetical protein